MKERTVPDTEWFKDFCNVLGISIDKKSKYRFYKQIQAMTWIGVLKK
jgi:hypothetical protein